MGLIYLTFQKTSGQGATPEGQPDQLHVGPVAHVQLYAGSVEVELREGHGDETTVADAWRVPGESASGYFTHRINGHAWPALRPYEGMCFGSVIIHDAGLLEADGVVIDLRRRQVQARHLLKDDVVTGPLDKLPAGMKKATVLDVLPTGTMDFVDVYYKDAGRKLILASAMLDVERS